MRIVQRLRRIGFFAPGRLPFSPTPETALLTLRRVRAENRFSVHLVVWAAGSVFLTAMALAAGGPDRHVGFTLAGLWGLALLVHGSLVARRGRRRFWAKHRALLAEHGRDRDGEPSDADDGDGDGDALREKLLRAAEDVRDILRAVSPETLTQVSQGETRALELVSWLMDADRLLRRHRVERELRREVATRLSRVHNRDDREAARRLLAGLDAHERALGALEQRVGDRRAHLESFLLALENAKIAASGGDLTAAVVPLSERVALLEETAAGRRRADGDAAEAATARIREEVRLAQDLQRSILPAAAPEVPGLEVAHLYRPSSEVGGDFYDFYVTAPERLLVALGDASGHGLDSSMVSSMAKSALYMQVSAGRGDGNPRLAAAMAEINRMMCDTLGRRRLMTLALVEVDAGSRTVAWVNAGQVYPLLRRGGEVRELEQPGYPLGVRRATEYQIRRESLQPGDLLVLLTDGYVEAADGAGEPLGWERLAERLAASRAGAGEILTELAADLERYLDGAPAQDDVTLVAIGFEP